MIYDLQLYWFMIYDFMVYDLWLICDDLHFTYW